MSYMAGLRNVWNTSKLATTNSNQQFTDQRFDDNKIQFLAFKNQLTLGLERIMHCAARITQGNGPYKLHLKSSEKPSYIHIDG